MLRIMGMCVDTAVAGLLLAPLFWYLNKRYFSDGKRAFWYWAMAVYLCEVISLVGLPNVRYVRLHLNINLKPFSYFFTDDSSLLNVFLFLPLGFFLPVLWTAFRKVHWTVLFGFCTSLTIELLQIFTFRATDVNDLMTNTFGTLVGWCIGRLALWAVPGIEPSGKTKDVYLVCGVSFLTMFFLHPFLANLVWSIIL